jgi:hypothetical protein
MKTPKKGEKFKSKTPESPPPLLPKEDAENIRKLLKIRNCYYSDSEGKETITETNFLKPRFKEPFATERKYIQGDSISLTSYSLRNDDFKYKSKYSKFSTIEKIKTHTIHVEEIAEVDYERNEKEKESKKEKKRGSKGKRKKKDNNSTNDTEINKLHFYSKQQHKNERIKDEHNNSGHLLLDKKEMVSVLSFSSNLRSFIRRRNNCNLESVKDTKSEIPELQDEGNLNLHSANNLPESSTSLFGGHFGVSSVETSLLDVTGVSSHPIHS